MLNIVIAKQHHADISVVKFSKWWQDSSRCKAIKTYSNTSRAKLFLPVYSSLLDGSRDKLQCSQES